MHLNIGSTRNLDHHEEEVDTDMMIWKVADRAYSRAQHSTVWHDEWDVKHKGAF